MGLETALIASTVFGAVSSVQQGMAANAAAKYNARVSENNARQAELSAKYDEDRHRDNVMRLMGSQRARYAAAGIDPNSDTALDVMADTAIQSELDALALRYGGKVQSSAYKDQANLDRAAGKNAMMAGYMGAGGSLLTGYSDYKTAQAKGLL